MRIGLMGIGECLFCILIFVEGAFAAYTADLIEDLPGGNDKINFTQYSGYLNGSPDENIQLHYWFVTAQNDPDNAPLVLWLNGGPGCSSMEGVLYEHGPQLVSDDGKFLKYNPYSWNHNANIIYLESPQCVGYSYAKNDNCSTDDDMTSYTNYVALLDFYLKFPEYDGRELFLAGESYAGIYIPTLAERILKSDAAFKDHLVGMMIGNGYYSLENNTNSLMTFAYNHGIVSDEDYESLWRECCHGNQVRCNFFRGPGLTCQYEFMKMHFLIHANPNLNIYNIIDACSHGYNFTRGDVQKFKRTVELMHAIDSDSATAFYEYVSGKLGPNCINSYGGTVYMNREDVREALHIPSDLGEWEICSTSIDYDKTYKNVISQFNYILNSGVRALVYNGDVDAACNFLGGSWFIQELDVSTSEKYFSWTVDSQVGGWGRNYSDILQFMTVRAAGHTVPQYKPFQSLYLFESFLSNDYDLIKT